MVTKMIKDLEFKRRVTEGLAPNAWAAPLPYGHGFYVVRQGDRGNGFVWFIEINGRVFRGIFSIFRTVDEAIIDCQKDWEQRLKPFIDEVIL
jgi:hypothetical protein